jgi:hypothetical protein
VHLRVGEKLVVEKSTRKVQGRYREGTGKVQGRYREGTGKVQGRCPPSGVGLAEIRSRPRDLEAYTPALIWRGLAPESRFARFLEGSGKVQGRFRERSAESRFARFLE